MLNEDLVLIPIPPIHYWRTALNLEFYANLLAIDVVYCRIINIVRVGGGGGAWGVEWVLLRKGGH